MSRAKFVFYRSRRTRTGDEVRVPNFFTTRRTGGGGDRRSDVKHFLLGFSRPRGFVLSPSITARYSETTAACRGNPRAISIKKKKITRSVVGGRRLPVNVIMRFIACAEIKINRTWQSLCSFLSFPAILYTFHGRFETRAAQAYIRTYTGRGGRDKYFPLS